MAGGLLDFMQVVTGVVLIVGAFLGLPPSVAIGLAILALVIMIFSSHQSSTQNLRPRHRRTR